jgi:iron complex transport system substrate-binding protein
MQRLRSAGIPATVLALVVVTLVACGHAATLTATGQSSPQPSAKATPAPSPAFPLTLQDDDGVTVTLASAPARIVTFAPANTEIVYALGLGSRLVGVSGTYDDYPPQAKELPHVGGAGNFGVDPNIEKVVALHPDLMLTTSGGEQWKARLRQVGITVFAVDATDLDDLLHDIVTVGQVTGAAAAAERLVAEMRTRADAIQSQVATQPAVSCFYEVYYPPLTTAGPHTFVFDLLQRAGCDPVTAHAKAPYPEWSVEQLVNEDPQVYLLDSLSGSTPAAVAKRHGFQAIAAVHDGHVLVIDSNLVTRPGPRIVDGLEALARALHPGAFGTP